MSRPGSRISAPGREGSWRHAGSMPSRPEAAQADGVKDARDGGLGHRERLGDLAPVKRSPRRAWIALHYAPCLRRGLASACKRLPPVAPRRRSPRPRSRYHGAPPRFQRSRHPAATKIKLGRTCRRRSSASVPGLSGISGICIAPTWIGD